MPCPGLVREVDAGGEGKGLLLNVVVGAALAAGRWWAAYCKRRIFVDGSLRTTHAPPHMNLTKLTAKELTKAASIQARIEELEAQTAKRQNDLAAVLAGGGKTAETASKPAPAKKAPAAKATRKKRTMSPETRAKMAASAKRRYARLRAAKAGKK